MEKAYVEILKGHLEPVVREASYETYGEPNIRYMKHARMLGCYYDYVTGREFIFTTRDGRAMLEILRTNGNVMELMDYLDNGGEAWTPEYNELIRKGIEPSPYGIFRCSTPGYRTFTMCCRSSRSVRPSDRPTSKRTSAGSSKAGGQRP